MPEIPYDQLTRKERLRVWMMHRGLTYAAIADAIAASRHSVATWLMAETIPVLRRKRLQAFGIPGDLLPPGVNKRPGRKVQRCVLALPPAAADAEPDSTAAAN